MFAAQLEMCLQPFLGLILSLPTLCLFPPRRRSGRARRGAWRAVPGGGGDAARRRRRGRHRGTRPGRRRHLRDAPESAGQVRASGSRPTARGSQSQLETFQISFETMTFTTGNGHAVFPRLERVPRIVCQVLSGHLKQTNK